MSTLAETREPFLAPYWGEVTEMDEQSTNMLGLRHGGRPDTEAATHLGKHILGTWRDLLNDEQLVCDHIGAGEEFDPFDQELSQSKFYQASGAIMLVDVERMGRGVREVPLEEGHEEQFHANSIGFFSSAQQEKLKKTIQGFGLNQIISPRADLAFSDPEDKLTLYERSVRLIGMLRTTTGASIAVEPELSMTSSGDDITASVKLGVLVDTITRGLPTVQETVLERDEDGDPLHVKRIRSLTVIRRGLFKPPKGNMPTKNRRLSGVISAALTPPGPRLADI